MKPKNQRLVLVIAAIAALMAAVLLAMWGLRSQASYFYTPSDVWSGKAEFNRAVRLGGMVDNAFGVIGIELLAAAQGCDFHAPLTSSPALEAVRSRLRRSSGRAEQTMAN